LAASLPTDVGLDSDTDGLPNWYEFLVGSNPNVNDSDTDADGFLDLWERYYFGNLNHHGDDPDSDEDGDGLSLAAEYHLGTDPGSEDTDDDGVHDLADQFPTDDRRSESIPLRYYGAIDLTESLGSFPTITTLALGDDNQVAFAGGSGSDTQVALWKDGAITSTFSAPGNDLGSNFSPGAINASGTLFGTSWNFEPYFRAVVGRLTSTGLTELGDDYMSSPHGVSVGGVSASGAIFGSVGWDQQPGIVQRGFVGMPGNLVHFDLDDAPYYGSGVAFTGWAISPGGVCVGHGGDGPRQLFGACLANSSALDFLPPLSTASGAQAMQPYAVNDQRQVVGWSGIYDSHDYPLGFLTTPSSVQNFHDLLPEKYRKQLRSAIPYLITNVDPVTSQPTITFGAEVLKGDSTGDWVPAVFQWEKSATGEVTIHEVQTPAGETPTLLAQNSYRDYAGQARPIDAVPGAPTKPSFLPSVNFHPVDIDKGFDPYMEDDVSHDLSKDKDKVPHEFWTSVSRKQGGKFIKNENIKLVFNSADAAKICEVVVRAGPSAGLITVAPELPQEKETTLTIQGKPGSQDQPEDAFVDVRNKATGKVINTLSVKVMPERTIQYRVWYLKDVQPASDLTQIGPTPRPYFEELLKQKLQNAFHQACIDLVEAGTPQEVVVNYDSNGDGALQVNTAANGPPHPEFTDMLNDTTHFTAKLNILVARRGIRYPTPNFQAVGSEEVNKVFVFTDSFLPAGAPENSPAHTYSRIPHVCAHEVGHALGLSTRNQNLTTSFGKHDSGRFPGFPWRQPLELPAEGLMIQRPKKDQMWMRHEDWKKANEIAGEPLFK